jgi:hypothetical protein
MLARLPGGHTTIISHGATHCENGNALRGMGAEVGLVGFLPCLLHLLLGLLQSKKSSLDVALATPLFYVSFHVSFCMNKFIIYKT